MAVKYGGLIRLLEYHETDLPLLLRYDEWQTHFGLLILIGVNPRRSHYNRLFDIEREVPKEVLLPLSVHIEHNTIMGLWTGLDAPFDPNFTTITRLERKEQATRFAQAMGEILSKKVTVKQAKEIFNIINKEQRQFHRENHAICSLWFSGHKYDRNKTYPPKYFIDWALKKKFQIPWLDWAKEEGFLKTDKPLDTRKEKTYQIIIGALLEYIKGDAPGTAIHPDFKSQAKLIEFFESYELPGLSKTTLEKRFSEAKKALNSQI